MADHFPFKLKRRSTIAVMGLPYTFRQEMGEYISKWAKCSNLKFEVILNAFPNVAFNQGAAAIINPSDVAFDILCETALSLLGDFYQPNCVVINFPIPTKPQLQKLTSLHDRSRRLLIIECQRRNKFRWRQAVEHPDSVTFLNPRYRTGNRKPGKWEDVEKAILNHQQQGLDDDYFLTLSPRVDVKKLVVDPFEDLKARDFTDNKELDRRSLFAQAIKHYLACDEDEYEELPVNLEYAVWRRRWLEQQASSRGTITTERKWCGPGDCILRFTNKLEAEAICEACDEKVTCTEGAYYCPFCSLSLHELCAVPLSPSALTANTTIPLSQLLEAYASPWLRSPFKESTTHACYSCEKEGKQFSRDCDACVFRSHLKRQHLPTALKHSCDEDHFLSIRLSWGDFDNALYDCKACGLRGVYSSYCCNICNWEYHLGCVLELPLHTKNKEHGGHTHSMKMEFSCGEREEEYEWCGVCYDDINPETWVYSCQDCDFVAHLYCIFPSHLFEKYKRITLSDYWR